MVGAVAASVISTVSAGYSKPLGLMGETSGDRLRWFVASGLAQNRRNVAGRVAQLTLDNNIVFPPDIG